MPQSHYLAEPVDAGHQQRDQNDWSSESHQFLIPSNQQRK